MDPIVFFRSGIFLAFQLMAISIVAFFGIFYYSWFKGRRLFSLCWNYKDVNTQESAHIFLAIALFTGTIGGFMLSVVNPEVPPVCILLSTVLYDLVLYLIGKILLLIVIFLKFIWEYFVRVDRLFFGNPK